MYNIVCFKLGKEILLSNNRLQDHLDELEARYQNWAGPSKKEEEDARRRSHNASMSNFQHRSPQGNTSHIIGTPRKAKHRGDRIAGVSIK